MKKNSVPDAATSVVLLTSLVCSSHALAAGEATEGNTGPLTSGFFFTETVYPQAQGETQLTLQPSYFSNSGDGDDLQVDLVAEYGITDNFTVAAALIPYRKLHYDETDDQSGPGDLALGIKYAFEKNDSLELQVAAGFNVIFPTGDQDEGLGDGNRVYEPFIAVSKDFGADANIHLNLAYGVVDVVNRPHTGDVDEPFDAVVEEGKDGANQLAFNLGFVTRLSAEWRGTAELNLDTNEIDDGDETEALFTPGLIWVGLDAFEFGIGVPIGLTDDSPDWGLIAKASYEF